MSLDSLVDSPGVSSMVKLEWPYHGAGAGLTARDSYQVSNNRFCTPVHPYRVYCTLCMCTLYHGAGAGLTATDSYQVSKN